jgi:hypothetical protein
MSDTARQLVEQMTAAGEWPEPRLLQDILAQGDAAVEPLREVVRREVHGWPDEAPLCFAVDLLGGLGAASAIPDLLALFSRYDNETLQSVSTTLGLFGGLAFDALLDVVRNPALNPYQRTEATTAAIMAAGEAAGLRERLAAVLRELLADHVARAADLTEEESQMASFLVTDLTQLGDPQARGLIDAAFQAGIVDRMLIRPEDVAHYYSRGRADIPRPEPRAWLEEYEDLYQEEMQAQRDLAENPAGPKFSRWSEPPAEEAWEPPPGPPPVQRSGPRIGRNDPCWCGSGKQYKHCHLKTDQA